MTLDPLSNLTQVQTSTQGCRLTEMANRLTFDEQLREATHLVKRARIFYDIWWFYEGADTRLRISDILNTYPEYFRFDSHAHFVSMVIHLAALYEKRDGTVNLAGLINQAEVAGVSKMALDSARALMSKHAAMSSKTAILRSNLFAHRSASMTFAEAFQKAAIKPNDLRDLTVVALNITNILLNDLGMEEECFHVLSREDVEKLISHLANANAPQNFL